MSGTRSSIVALTGPVAAGKTSLANSLVAQHDFVRMGTRELIFARLPDTPHTRGDLQAAGDRLDQETHGAWVAWYLVEFMRENPKATTIVIDSLRRQEQISAIQRTVTLPVVHVHVTAPFDVRKDRYGRHFVGPGEFSHYEDVATNLTEALVDRLEQIADLVIDSARVGVTEAAKRVVGRIDSLD